MVLTAAVIHGLTNSMLKIYCVLCAPELAVSVNCVLGDASVTSSGLMVSFEYASPSPEMTSQSYDGVIV